MKPFLIFSLLFISVANGTGYYEFDFYDNKPNQEQVEVECILKCIDPDYDKYRSHPSHILSAVKTYAALNNPAADTFELYIRTMCYIEAYRRAHDIHLK